MIQKKDEENNDKQDKNVEEIPNKKNFEGQRDENDEGNGKYKEEEDMSEATLLQ